MFKAAPFDLLDYCFDSVCLERNPGFSGDGEAPAFPEGTISVQRSIGQLEAGEDVFFRIQMKVGVKQKPGLEPPFTGHVHMQALLQFPYESEISLEDRYKIVGVTGASMLYGVAREMFFSMSSRIAPSGRGYLLPTVAFDPEKVLNNAKES